MKKIISLLVCFVLVFSLSISAFAAGNAKVNSNTSANVVKLGDTITVTVSLSDCDPFKSMALTPNYDKNVFEMVSGEWLLTGATLSNFNGTNAAIAYTPVVEKSGDIFKYVLKVKDNATLKNTTIKTDAVIKNGATTVESTAVSVTVKVICKSHNFGAWSKVDNNNHKRTCSACDHVETATHKWDSGKITKAPTCKEAGTKVFSCTVCNATKTESIAKTNEHKFGDYSVTKAPTCTAKGTESRTCSICQKVETKDIAALGHKFSDPTVTKEPTCTETGIESGKCTVCGKTTTNTIKATGHKMGESVVIKEPTCTEEGLKEGTCTVCGEKAQEAIAAKGHTFGEAVVTKEATKTETGLKTKTCTACGAVEEEEIPFITSEPADTNADQITDVATDENNDDASNNNMIWIIIAIAAVVLVGGAIVTIILLKKKKANTIE